ncbi:MAG: hypothetical protein U9N53_05490, partial [Bacteroidota bacterium]|nr:hypothetical protein [Bacteroidota bacterium]
MKNLIFLLSIVLIFSACTPENGKIAEPESDFSGKLTQEEIAGGKMTAEILWKFGRVGDVQVSPDNSTIVFSLTRYDSKTNKSSTKLHLLPVEGGEVVDLSAMKSFHPRWSEDGSKIGFLSAESGSVQ